jgi:hypothetical protein
MAKTPQELLKSRIKRFNEAGERWAIVPGFSRYAASDKGEVENVLRCGTMYYRMKPHKNSNGYLQVNVTDDSGKRRTMRVHRLVGLAFGIIEPHEMINHIDGVKTNNSVSNLEKTTPTENNRHAYRLGLNKGLKGEQNGLCKISDADAPRIRMLYEFGLTLGQIAAVYGVRVQTVNAVTDGSRLGGLENAALKQYREQK